MSAALNPETYRAVLESLPTGVYLVDCDRRILLWNQGAEELTGYLRQEVIGRCCHQDLLLHCDETEACLCGTACPLQHAMHDGRPRSAELFLLHKNGQRVPVQVRAVPVRDERGTIIGAVEWFDRRVVLPAADPDLCKLRSGASVDEVTGLPDRAAVLACLAAQLESYEVSAVPFGVISVAVDKLEEVRQTGGSSAVNALLYGTAQTLANAMSPGDMVARWSDERFLAVVTGCTAPALRRAAGLMKRLACLEGVMWWGERIQATVSMGGAMVQAGDTPERLVGRSEAALACSILQGGDCVAVA